jgi:ornithine cyclodeaminase
MDGRYITEARTAAVSAVSARRLADLSQPQVLAVLGSGVQARAHLEALLSVSRIDRLRVWSPTRERRDAIAADARTRHGVHAAAVDDARTAVADATLIVLATASPTPVVQSGWVADGAHIMAVGACRPNQREMDSALVTRGHLYVDSRAGALKEAGDILIPIAEGCVTASHVRGELGEVITGAARGRETRQAVTIFKSLGMAVEDVAAAHLAYRRALDASLGQTVEI